MPFERWERAKKKKFIWGLIEVFLCFFDFEGSCSSLCFFLLWLLLFVFFFSFSFSSSFCCAGNTCGYKKS